MSSCSHTEAKEELTSESSRPSGVSAPWAGLSAAAAGSSTEVSWLARESSPVAIVRGGTRSESDSRETRKLALTAEQDRCLLPPTTRLSQKMLRSITRIGRVASTSARPALPCAAPRFAPQARSYHEKVSWPTPLALSIQPNALPHRSSTTTSALAT